MPLNPREKKDIKILVRFIHIFCRQNHAEDSKRPFSSPYGEVASLIDAGLQLCEFCSERLSYGIRERFQCPHDPKPMCKKCET